RPVDETHGRQAEVIEPRVGRLETIPFLPQLPRRVVERPHPIVGARSRHAHERQQQRAATAMRPTDSHRPLLGQSYKVESAKVQLVECVNRSNAITSGLRQRFPGRSIGTARFTFRRSTPLIALLLIW